MRGTLTRGLKICLITFVILVSMTTGFSSPVAADTSCSDYPIHDLALQSDSDTPLTAAEISADTRLGDTDTFGNNPGEPYLQIDIDGSEVVQTELVERESTHQTTLQIPEEEVNALEPGQHSVTAILWDQDGDNIDDTDLGNDDAVCEATTTFQVEENVESKIQSAGISDVTDSDDDGYYSAFTVDIDATTVLERSDTSGNNPGEPYFQIEIGDEAVHTSEVVRRGEGETFRVRLSNDDLKEFKHGQYDIEVEFWDKDGDEIDDTDIGDDDDIDEWQGSVKIEQPLDLRASRSTTVVGSPVAFQLDGATGGQVDWEISEQPSTNDASLRTENRDTVSLRPTAPGDYEITAKPGGSPTTKSVTITVEENDHSEILRKYAPRVHYRYEEKYRPTRYESFIYNSRLQQFGEENIPNPTVFDLQGKEDWELDLNGSNDDYPSYQEKYPPAVYGSVQDNAEFRGESYTAVTYWLFYVYDPKQSDSIGSLLSHQSDLETVTILLQDGQPKWVGASQHYGGELRKWSAAPTDDTHLQLYPALGAHSNYLRNTENYSGEGIPIQEQFIDKDSTTTSIFIPGLEYFDKTGDDVVYAHDGTSDENYQVIPLTGNEAWSEFQGTLGPNDDAGALPFDRERWMQPGQWMESNLPSSNNQVNVGVQHSDLTVGSDTIESTLTLVNEGPKPHPVWIVVEAKPVAAEWDSSQSITLYEEPVFVGFGETKDTLVEAAPPESNGVWNVRTRLTSYPPSVVGAVRTFQQVTSGQTVTVETPTSNSTTDNETSTTPSNEKTNSTDQSETNPTEQSENDSTEQSENDSTGQPGFGVSAAVIAVLVSLIIARKR